MDEKKKILITGATGFIGKALIHQLIDRGYHIVALSRNAEKARHVLPKVCDVFTWKPTMEAAPIKAFDNVWGVINLVGENIIGLHWNQEKKKAIRDSRIAATRHLVQTLRRLTEKPSILVSSSAVGIYGNRKDKILYEHSATGLGFLSNLCRDWESETDEADELHIRKVIIRTGIVLGKGGVLNQMLKGYKFGLGATLGTGKQWFSWIHIDDLVAMIMFALEHEEIKGIYNAVAPHPVTQAEFSKTLGKVLHRPAFLRMPTFFFKKFLGEMGESLLMSQRVSSQKIEKSGFKFHYSELETALKDICAF